MKAITGLVVLALASTAAGEDTEERKRARAEKLAMMSSHMSRHLRNEGLGHQEQARTTMMRHVRMDERDGLKAREPPANKAEHAEKIRRVADQMSEQNRARMERSMPHGLHNARAAQHSLADMRTNKDSSRKSSDAQESADQNARKKETLDKLAMHMSHHFDATAARNAAANGDYRTMRAAHDVAGRISGHGAAPMRETMDASRPSGMQHRLAQPAPQHLHRQDATGENSNPAEEGEV